jgi:hypothetical protein
MKRRSRWSVTHNPMPATAPSIAAIVGLGTSISQPRRRSRSPRPVCAAGIAATEGARARRAAHALYVSFPASDDEAPARERRYAPLLQEALGRVRAALDDSRDRG